MNTKKELSITGNSTPPKDFDKLRQVIIAQRSDLPKRLAQIAEYALNNPDEIAFGTVASVATAAAVQPSTLVRFARHFNFNGFSEMQDLFQLRLKRQASSYHDRIAALREEVADSPDANILNGFFKSASQSIGRVAQNIDTHQFSTAADRLANANTIYLIARRRAYPLASYMAYTFGKMGIRIHVSGSSIGIDDEMFAMATPNDVALAISFTPYAGESVRLARAVSQAGIPLIAITDSPFSPVAECSETWFEIAESDFSGFRSLSASMAFCMALTVAVAERHKDT